MNSSATGARPEISIVVPCFNEEKVLPSTAERLLEMAGQMECSFELVFVDDGSRDETPAILAELQASDPHIRVVRFSRNFGQQMALTAGLDYAQGKAVVVIDADLQDPPEVIPEMVARWRQGFDVVYGTREFRQGESVFKLQTASLFYRLINRISEVPIPLDTGDFRLMDRRVVEVLRTMPERDRFVRGMVSWVGFRQTAVPYVRVPRAAGETKYSLRKMLGLALDGIISFSNVPLRMFTLLGVLSAAAGLVGGVAAMAISLGEQRWLQGWLYVLPVVLFLGGVQLVSLGILGEYLGRVYDQTKRRPLYVVQETRGFEQLLPDDAYMTAQQRV